MQAKNLGPGQQVVIGGCGRQTPPPPVSSPVPVRNVAFLLEQCSRRWNLGVLGHDVGDTPARSLTGRRPPSAVEMFMSSLLGGLHAPP